LATAVESRQLTTWAMARPVTIKCKKLYQKLELI
jgi:hypothetical protein